MVERAEGLVWCVFLWEPLVAMPSSSFPVTLHVAAPSPQAASSICKSNLLSFGSVVNAVLFCFQPPSSLHIAPPSHINPHLPSAWLFTTTSARSCQITGADTTHHMQFVLNRHIQKDSNTLTFTYPWLSHKHQWQITVNLRGSRQNSL